VNDAASEAARAGAGAPEAVRARLLLVDDNGADRYVLRRYLNQSQGRYELLECDNLRAAAELCAREAVDVVLLDYRLADGTGLELLERLRAAPLGPQVIMTTGTGNERVAVQAMKAGACDYLPKDGLTASALTRSVGHALELRRLEVVLGESEQRFATLADAAPALIWLADPDARAEFLNQGWLDFCGQPLEASLGAGWLAAIHEADRAPFLARYREAARANAPFRHELRLRSPAGDRWVSCAARPRTGALGEVRGFVGACFDISQQRQSLEQSERARAESEETYRLLFSSMLSGVIWIDEQGRILEANPAALDILALTRERILGASIFDPSWRPTGLDGAPLGHRDLPAWRALRSGQPEASFFSGVTREDGKRVWLLSNAVPFAGPGGERPGGAVITFVDVTALREATAALERSEQRYRTIFDAQLSAIIGTDAQGKIASANPAALRLFGYGLEELRGRNLWILLDDGVDFTALLARSEAQRSAHLGELEFRRKAGERFPAEVSVAALQDGEGTAGYVYTLRDISGQREAETKLAETNRRLLQGRDDERRRLARDLHDGTVQDLVALGYELANLERDVKRSGEPLSLEELLERLAAWRGDVAATIRQLREVISNLRPAGLEEFGLGAVLESYLASLGRNGAPLPDLRLNTEGDLRSLELPVSLCLFRSVQEAVTNALKHAGAGRVIIRLTRRAGEVSLAVEDDGRGFMPPPDLSVLAQEQHFGLIGLAERAELMGGTCMVNSQPGRGTAVLVTLPLEAREHA
jgi:PAS domain S-box-containing protein